MRTSASHTITGVASITAALVAALGVGASGGATTVLSGTLVDV